jgi:hypothetical protein
VPGRELSGALPLGETCPVSGQVGSYSKHLNIEVIRHMQATDFDGTDLDATLFT